MNLSSLAVCALLPLAIGPLPQDAATMRVTICSGLDSYTLEKPIPGKQPDLPKPCPAKACHAACSRKQFDRAQ